jgi:hypothetical protein
MGYRITASAAADIINIYAYGAGRFGCAQPLLMRERLEFRPPVRLRPYHAHLYSVHMKIRGSCRAGV